MGTGRASTGYSLELHGTPYSLQLPCNACPNIETGRSAAPACMRACGRKHGRTEGGTGKHSRTECLRVVEDFHQHVLTRILQMPAGQVQHARKRDSRVSLGRRASHAQDGAGAKETAVWWGAGTPVDRRPPLGRGGALRWSVGKARHRCSTGHSPTNNEPMHPRTRTLSESTWGRGAPRCPPTCRSTCCWNARLAPTRGTAR